VIEHFKSDDPVGFPSLPIPDPVSAPDVQQNLKAGKLSMSKIKIHGLTKFRIQNVSVQVDRKMEAFCGLMFDTLVMDGNYSLSSFIAKSNGRFT
jgi:hypothetical protein